MHFWENICNLLNVHIKWSDIINNQYLTFKRSDVINVQYSVLTAGNLTLIILSMYANISYVYGGTWLSHTFSLSTLSYKLSATILHFYKKCRTK